MYCGHRQLAYGNVPDSYDKSLAMTARECLDNFCKVVLKLYSREFLRKPSSHDIALIYQAHEERHHLLEMLGSLDCTHWPWRSCPYALRGSNNDINGLHQSPLFLRDKQGIESSSIFTVNGHPYRRVYYLVDGIYPAWSTFVKGYTYPTDRNQKVFTKMQSVVRKDVERTFGVLKAKWQILSRPVRGTTSARLGLIMYACIILHNMVIKDEGNGISPIYIPDPPIEPNESLNYTHELRNEETHYRLPTDLVDHNESLNLDIEVDVD